MARKYKATTETSNGPRKCLKVVVQRGEKKPLVAQFGGIPLQRKQDAILVDRQPQFLKKPGRKEKPAWVKQMATRRRKTLVVCRLCHQNIHAGKTTTPFRKQGLESRVRGKLACSVRE